MTPLEKATKIVKILDSKKAVNIRVLNVTGLTSLGDYFVIASGNSTTQVNALAGEVAFQMKQDDLIPRHIEQGERSAEWVLLDFSDVLVHIFYRDTRGFYDLERLWADAPEVNVEELLKANQ